LPVPEHTVRRGNLDAPDPVKQVTRVIGKVQCIGAVCRIDPGTVVGKPKVQCIRRDINYSPAAKVISYGIPHLAQAVNHRPLQVEGFRPLIVGRRPVDLQLLGVNHLKSGDVRTDRIKRVFAVNDGLSGNAENIRQRTSQFGAGNTVNDHCKFIGPGEPVKSDGGIWLSGRGIKADRKGYGLRRGRLFGGVTLVGKEMNGGIQCTGKRLVIKVKGRIVVQLKSNHVFHGDILQTVPLGGCHGTELIIRHAEGGAGYHLGAGNRIKERLNGRKAFQSP
jgi:hypothetical protein